MAGRFSVEAVFKAVDKVTAPVSKMQNRVLKFTRRAAKSLSKLNRGIDRLVKGMARGATRIAAFGAAIVGAVSGAVITALNRAADAADALAKETRRLDFPIEEFQEWRFVAEQSGVSNELLSKSMGAFSKRLGEAKAGFGPLVSGLKNANPELLKQLQNAKSVSEALEIYIEAMRNTDDATKKAALASAAFSRAGLKMANLADNSAEAIKKLRLEQRENGNITKQQAEAAEAYNDAINSLKRSVIGLVQGALLPMAPAITDNLRQWREWIVANRELIQVRIVEFLTKLKEQIFKVVEAVIEFNNKYDIPELLNKGIEVLISFASFLSKNAGLIFKIIAAVVVFSGVLKTLIMILTAVNLVMSLNPIGLIILGITALIAAISAVIIWWDELKATLMRNIEAWSFVGLFFQDLWRDIESSFSEGLSMLFSFVDSVKGIFRPLVDFFTGLWEGITSIFEQEIEQIMGVINKVQGLISSITDTVSNIASDATDVADKAVTSVKGAFTSLGSLFGDDEKKAPIEMPGRQPGAIDSVLSSIGKLFGDDEEQDTAGGITRRPPRLTAPQIVSPQERISRFLEEKQVTSTAEVTIKDETGRAAVTDGQLGAGLKLESSGAM